MFPESCASDRSKNKKKLKHREYSNDNDRCNNDSECLNADLTILKSFIKNLTTMNESGMESTRTRRTDDEVARKNANVTGSLGPDRSMIYESSEDKNFDGETVREHCPLNVGANAKDEACRCVDDAKESGRTDRSKRTRKDHAARDGEEIIRKFNVNESKAPTNARLELSAIDEIAKSSSTKKIIVFKDALTEANRSDNEENEIYPCGCKTSEEMHFSVASENSDGVDSFCEARQSAARDRKKNFENLEDEARFVAAMDGSTTKRCYCGCAEMIEAEDNTMYEIGDVVRSRKNGGENKNDESSEEDIEELTTRLEDELHSVKAKNEELKRLMKSCYCDDDVDEILALQCSQPAPIRATYSGLTTAIEVLRSKCHTKDRMITTLASELRGSKDIDRIARNLTAPCLQFTYRDFDQCGLYSYLKNSKAHVHPAEENITHEESVTKSPREIFHERDCYRTKKPTNFRIVRDICNCLLVSWNMPENIRGLRGYEIVINGNVVAARVRNPTRTEAVLGPFELSGTAEFPGTTILTLYAIDSHGNYSELSSIKF